MKPKFASERGGEWLPHDYGKVFAWQNAGESLRLCAGVSYRGAAVLRALAGVLEEPLMLLYVLVVSRRDGLPGRYQSGELSRAELGAFFDRFGAYWDGDGRHSIWLHSPADAATLVYDRHNLLYAYGPLDRFESVLTSLGYTLAAELSVSFVHQHAYQAEFDSLESEITALLAEGWTELREGDDLP